MLRYGQDIGDKFGPEKIAVGWPWRLFIVALAVFSLSLVTYFGLMLSYESVLRNQIGKLDEEIAALNLSVPAVEQENFVAFYSQMANLQNVLKAHISASQVFPFLERLTDKGVYYQKVDVSAAERRVKLDGLSSSFEILSSQLAALESAPEIERVFLESSSLAESGSVKFTASVIFNREFFRFQ